MSGETNTETNSGTTVWARFGRYFLSQISSDSAELTTGSKSDDKEDGKEAEKTEVDQKTDETEVNLEDEKVKAAIAAKVEATIGARVAREKGKIDAAEAKATAAEEKLTTAEATIATLTSEKTEAKKSLDEALKNVTVYKLSIEEGVSPDLINSLKGEDEATLRTAIKNVLAAGGKTSVNRIFDGKDTSKTTSANGKSQRDIVLAAAARQR